MVKPIIEWTPSFGEVDSDLLSSAARRPELAPLRSIPREAEATGHPRPHLQRKTRWRTLRLGFVGSMEIQLAMCKNHWRILMWCVGCLGCAVWCCLLFFFEMFVRMVSDVLVLSLWDMFEAKPNNFCTGSKTALIVLIARDAIDTDGHRERCWRWLAYWKKGFPIVKGDYAVEEGGVSENGNGQYPEAPCRWFNLHFYKWISSLPSNRMFGPVWSQMGLLMSCCPFPSWCSKYLKVGNAGVIYNNIIITW